MNFENDFGKKSLKLFMTWVNPSDFGSYIPKFERDSENDELYTHFHI